MHTALRLSVAAAILATLAACGGSSGDEGESDARDVAPSFVVSTQQAAPIVHTFTEAGTYELTLTGDYAPTSSTLDSLDVWFSFSGQGSVTGNGQPTYTVNGKDTKVRQSVTVTLTGQGPWEMTVLCGTIFASGTMSALTLDTSRN
jgi:hypothetical protein